MWRSKASWDRIHGFSLTVEEHETESEALSRCERLQQFGLGGEGLHFPIRVWVEPVGYSIHGDSIAIGNLGFDEAVAEIRDWYEYLSDGLTKSERDEFISAIQKVSLPSEESLLSLQAYADLVMEAVTTVLDEGLETKLKVEQV